MVSPAPVVQEVLPVRVEHVILFQGADPHKSRCRKPIAAVLLVPIRALRGDRISRADELEVITVEP